MVSGELPVWPTPVVTTAVTSAVNAAMSRLRTFSVLFLSVLSLLATGCREKSEKPSIPVPKVVLEEVQVREVQPYVRATGYTEAFEFVEIPARVSGVLREIRYKPGGIVKPGDPLFLIEPNQYQAEVKAAEAQLASAQAQLKLSQANLERTRELIAQRALTQQDLETDQAKTEMAAADVLKAEAALETAKLNLSYTDVRSPVGGQTARNLVDLGNFVGPTASGASGSQSHSVLTTVAGMDPIYVYFDISDYQFNSIRQFAKEKQEPAVVRLAEELQQLKAMRKAEKTAVWTGTDGDGTATETETSQGDSEESADQHALNVVFEMALLKGAAPGEEEYPFQGIIDMTANVIDRSTGTMTIRGAIPNAEYTIFPGQVCRVRIPLWKMPDAVLVRQESVGTDLNQTYVYVVDEKNVAQRRVVQLGLVQPDGTRVVEKGLEKGERYIVSGIQKVRDGITVKPVTPKTLETKESEDDSNDQNGKKPETEPAR